MREIKFRGKRVDGKWIYGAYGKGLVDVFFDGTEVYRFYIMEWTINTGKSALKGYFTDYVVDPATVGQYTGLKDKNGKEIFEGDILRHWHNSGAVKFGEHDTDALDFYGSGAYGFYVDGKKNQTALVEAEKTEVIGNIHDNPELLEVE